MRSSLKDNTSFFRMFSDEEVGILWDVASMEISKTAFDI